MSGYLGNPDAEAEHALIIAENGIYASQQLLSGPQQDWCLDCGEVINPQRVEYLRLQSMKCVYCMTCQPQHDNPRRVKMLDRIL